MAMGMFQERRNIPIAIYGSWSSHAMSHEDAQNSDEYIFKVMVVGVPSS